jgi:3-deoxy-manno-octulosonate cytidylyltransferase (CMP-KDO synthetase)
LYQYGLENGKSPLEWLEDIEILRFVELGINVKMVETFGTTHSVDVPQDVDRVIEIINE